MFQTNWSRMFKADYIVYLWVYISISCTCKNNTVSHLNIWSAIELLRLTLRVNPWLWNPAQGTKIALTLSSSIAVSKASLVENIPLKISLNFLCKFFALLAYMQARRDCAELCALNSC